jgi:hypothetical protein
VKESDSWRLVQFDGCLAGIRRTDSIGTHESWEDKISEEEQWAKINIDRKGSSYCTLKRIVSKYHRTTAAQVTAELNIHLEEHVSTKTVCRDLHKPNIHGQAAVAKPLITKINAQTRKRWGHGGKTWTSDSCKQAGDMVKCCSLHQGDFIYVWRTPIEACNMRCLPGSNSETQRWFCDGLGSNIMVQYSFGPIITLHDRITARE